MLRVVLILVLCLTGSLGGSATAHAKDKNMTAVERYEWGLRLMNRGFHQKALEELNRVRNYHRDDPVSVLAQLAIADLHYKKGDYDQARYAYEDFVTYHPRHEHLDYVTWKIGMCIWKRAPKAAGRDQTSTRAAVSTWTGFDLRFPDSEFIEDVADRRQKAIDRLANKELFIGQYYADKNKWDAAENRARTVLARYPSSSHTSHARAMLSESMHAWGDPQGAKEIRDLLAESDPTSKFLVRLDRKLAKPPGEPPEPEVFTRPYRIRALANPGAPTQ